MFDANLRAAQDAQAQPGLAVSGRDDADAAEARRIEAENAAE
jgi:hypothetical protein